MSYLKKQPIENGIPHIYWDKGFTTKTDKKGDYTVPYNNYKLTKEQIWINRIKEWSFYIIVTLVVIYAVYRLIRM